MDVVRADEIRRELLKRYNANPAGWRVVVGRDPKGYYNLMVVQGSDMWLVKEFQVNPYESIGFGVKEKTDETEALSRISPTHPFGFRPIGPEQFSEIINATQNDESASNIINSIMEKRPVSLRSSRSPVGMQGPFIHTSAPLLSEKQMELDSRLRGELETLINRKHPHLARQFI